MLDTKMLGLAAKNLADRIGVPPSNEAIILHSPKKQVIANAIRDELILRGMRCKAADLMESEQARGTCHFGFGHNIGWRRQ